MLTHHKEMHSSCKWHKETPTNLWIQLNHKNQWIFSIPHSTTIDIICNGIPRHQDFRGQGIITMIQYCNIQLSDAQIQAMGRAESAITRDYTPNLNMTHFSNMIDKQKTISINKSSDFGSHIAEIDELKNNLQALQLSTREKFTKKSFNDIHHYTSIYIIVAFIMVICTMYKWQTIKNKITSSADNTDNAAPNNQNNQIDPNAIYNI